MKPRLLFTRDVSELEKIAREVEDQVRAQSQSQAKSEQIALDLNSILKEANQKFDDKYLRKSSNWKDFTPFVSQFISILNKVSDQAEGKTSVKESTKTPDPSGTEDYDAGEMLAEHEYFSLQGGKALLVFAYPGEPDEHADAPYSKTVEAIRMHLRELAAKYPGVEMKLTGEPALDADEIATSHQRHDEGPRDHGRAHYRPLPFQLPRLLRPTLTFLVLIMGVLWSLAFALVTVGHFNDISMAVIPMVLGIGIDFGIQILGRYEEELGLNRTPVQAITASLQHTGVAIITGGSTTAVAFFTLCFNDFVGLSNWASSPGASIILCIARQSRRASRRLPPARPEPHDGAAPGAVEQLGLAFHPRLGPQPRPPPLALADPGAPPFGRLRREPSLPPLRLQPAPPPEPVGRLGPEPA